VASAGAWAHEADQRVAAGMLHRVSGRAVRRAERAWDDLMHARRQAEDYVHFLPAGFIIVSDVGHRFE
jgi:hypothetical protein